VFKSTIENLALLAIEGMQFYAFHGYYEAERKAGGNYWVDVYVTLPEDVGKDDQLPSTLNYEVIHEITHEVMTVSAQLIEHIAHQLLSTLKNKFPEIEKFKVRVKKLNPPLPGAVESTSFEIEG
jgi:dihydroneopterin aldolase